MCFLCLGWQKYSAARKTSGIIVFQAYYNREHAGNCLIKYNYTQLLFSEFSPGLCLPNLFFS